MGAHAEAWVAAYRMTPEGRGFPGVTPASVPHGKAASGNLKQDAQHALE